MSVNVHRDFYNIKLPDTAKNIIKDDFMIKAEIFDQKIRLNTESVASDSVKFLKIQFLLDENWDTAFKTAVFKNEELDISTSVIMEEANELYLGDNTCIIPFEVIKPPCFSVSLSGIKGDTVITTIPSEIKVYKSGDISADEPESYTPSQYEQLVGIYNETKSIAESVRKDADNGAFNGKDGENGKDAVTEQNYNPESENAQSGKAVSEAVNGLNSVFAFAIKQNMSSRAIKISDASPSEHELKVNVKNYFDITKVIKTDKVQVNDDKTLTINNPNASSEYVILGKLIDISPDLKGGETINLFYKCNNSSNNLGLKTGNNIDIMSDGRLGNTGPLNYENGAHLTITLPTDISNIYVYFAGDYSTHILSEITVTCGEFTDLTDVTVSRYGKNLIGSSFHSSTAYGAVQTENGAVLTTNGITYFDNYSGVVTANGTATGSAFYIIRQKDLKLSKGTYYLSGCPAGGKSTTYNIYAVFFKDGIESKVLTNKSTSTSRAYDYGTGFSFEIPAEGAWTMSVVISISANTTVNNLVFKPQIEVGASRTEYEPYIAPQTATADADGVVKGLTSISPDMTLLADKDVVLDCEYIADTKLYIDNKLKEIKMLI